MINRRTLVMIMAVIMGMTVCLAQQIVVVSEDGETSICKSLEKAIETATNGSVIYLPGGSYRISDDAVITKKLCIIGLGHKAISGNTDGYTTIAANLWFNENSSGCSVIGCYISGDVIIGNDGNSVNDVVIKCCNINRLLVKNDNCTGTVVCQSYIRNRSDLKKGTLFTNNIAHSVRSECGKIVNNVLVNGSEIYTCYVARNIFLNGQGVESYHHNTFSDNMAKDDVGDAPVNIGEKAWSDLFVKYNNGSISPASDFHFKDEYKTLYKDYGIYGGTGFNASGQPPLPFFEAKSIPEQTDAEGNLNIRIRVNNGEKKAE